MWNLTCNLGVLFCPLLFSVNISLYLNAITHYPEVWLKRNKHTHKNNNKCFELCWNTRNGFNVSVLDWVMIASRSSVSFVRIGYSPLTQEWVPKTAGPMEPLGYRFKLHNKSELIWTSFSLHGLLGFWKCFVQEQKVEGGTSSPPDSAVPLWVGAAPGFMQSTASSHVRLQKQLLLSFRNLTHAELIAHGSHVISLSELEKCKMS